MPTPRHLAADTIDPAWDKRVRKKIQTSQVLNRLINFVEGPPSPKLQAEDGSVVPNPAWMAQSQVTAAVALLRKIVPDLSSQDHTGEVEHKFVVFLPEPLTEEQWEQEVAKRRQPATIEGKANGSSE